MSDVISKMNGEVWVFAAILILFVCVQALLFLRLALRFNKKNIFPKLKPYKMDREAFQEALERGAGIPLEEKKKEKLEKLNAGELEELKKCILEKGVEIEQEILLAENAIAEN